MDTSQMIKITGADLIKLTQKAYELSTPRGMGYIHAKPGGLDEETAAKLITSVVGLNPNIRLSYDYLVGRAVKLTVWQDENLDLWVDDTWYDHSDAQLRELLAHVGIIKE